MLNVSEYYILAADHSSMGMNCSLNSVWDSEQWQHETALKLQHKQARAVLFRISLMTSFTPFSEHLFYRLLCHDSNVNHGQSFHD